MRRLKIAVLFGGCSTEYPVSLQSAHAVLTHLNRERYQPLAVGITRDGGWFLYTGLWECIASGKWAEDRANCIPCALSPNRDRHELLLLTQPSRSLAIDALFPVLHGKHGEDGTVQGLAELAGIPLIGCGVLSSALCMDKDRAHKLAALAGIAVPKSVLVRPQDRLDGLTLTYPLFVKPVRSGSSFGITRLERPEGLARAVAEAFRHDREVLLEEAVPGFEVGCAVLGNETLTVGVVDEIELSQGFFDYTEKYTLKTSQIHCPARIPPETAAQIQDAARTVYRALDCRGFARVDFFLTPAGKIVFNEVNTIPGFTAHSRYPAMMAAAGLGFSQLLDRIVSLGVAV